MSDIRITSNDQAGGITAQNVNTGNNSDFSVNNMNSEDNNKPQSTTISSTNQKGGVTGQNVNTGNNANFESKNTAPDKPKSRSKEIAWWLFGIAGAIAAVVSIFTTISTGK